MGRALYGNLMCTGLHETNKKSDGSVYTTQEATAGVQLYFMGGASFDPQWKLRSLDPQRVALKLRVICWSKNPRFWTLTDLYGRPNAISDWVFRGVPSAPAPLAATIATYCFPLLPR
jgi:hypothetical protein